MQVYKSACLHKLYNRICSPGQDLPAMRSPHRALTLPSICVVASTNGEQYRVVDVSSALTGSSIRERILSKMCIPDKSQSKFSIYPSEIGSYALGGALTDTHLFELCRDHGDPTGSLKFFVSPYPDRPAPHSLIRYPPCHDTSRRHWRLTILYHCNHSRRICHLHVFGVLPCGFDQRFNYPWCVR